jgi:RND family efflux transporter MFP subunit
MRTHVLTLPFALLALLLPGGSPATRAAPPAGAGFHPVIAVEASHPGASAAVVADTVAAPIEQQVNGVEHLAHMVSRCTEDGRYTLLLGFDSPRMDLDIAQVLVQNRVALAMPQLPEAVQRLGISVRKVLPGALLVVVLTSPDAKLDAAFLGTYAAVKVKDELARVAGVAGVSLLGGDAFSVRVLLDREKLGAVRLTPGDVLQTLREQRIKATTGDQASDRPGEPSQLRLERGGGLAAPADLADIILKASPAGRVVRLKDVARVELAGGSARGDANLNGRPAVALAIAALPTARPRAVGAAVAEQMERLKQSFPAGLDYDIPLDLAAGPAPPWCLLAEPVLPPATSAERAAECRGRYAGALRKTERVRHVLSLPEDPFSLFRGGPCVVAVFDHDMKEADWGRTRQVIHERLTREVRSASLRLRDLSGPAGARRDGYPVELAVRGSDEREVRDFAEALAARLTRTQKLTDVAAAPRPTPRIYADIDRKRALDLGVNLNDVSQALEVLFGSAEVEEGGPASRTTRVQVRLSGPAAGATEGVKLLQVRNAQGQMVPLSSVMSLKEVEGPARLDRVDIRPAAILSGNPAAGVSLAEARWLCETLAEQVRKERRLPAEYAPVWLGKVPAPKPMPGELKPGPEPVPPEVLVARPVSREVTDYENFTGRVEAADSVDLRARVTGYLIEVLFKDGAKVKKGDLLFKIDPRPYQEALDQAQANLKAAEAQRDLTRRALERLRANGATTAKADLDAAEANYNVAAAQADAAKAAASLAKLNLDWTTVRAPIDGRIGRALVGPGNLVKGDDTTLAHLVSLDPVYVYFEADERTVLRLEKLALAEKGKRLQEASLAASVGLADEHDYPRRGTVNFVDNRVNPDTGTLMIRAVLPDPKHELRPGLFARVRLATGAPHKALLVPEGAVLTDQGQKFVYIVDKDNRVVSRRVTLGSSGDGVRLISEGLRPEDRVITEGVGRVRPGETVRPVAALPKDE